MVALILDDMPEMTTLLRMVMEQSGYSVLTAANGKEGMTLMTMTNAEQPVRLVICDVHMPLLNGHDFIDCIRGEAPRAELAVIAMSVDPSAAARQRALQCGADRFLLKPFPFIDLSRSLLSLGLPPLRRMSGAAWV